MSEELMRVSDIPGPTVSGTVKMPLVEIDKLRADYLSAIKLAQNLEAKQGQIKITYSQGIDSIRTVEDQIWTPSRTGGGEHKTIFRHEKFIEFVDNVEYKNLEDILLRLRQEAQANVKEEVEALKLAKSSAHVNCITAEGALEDYKNELPKLKTKLRKEFRVEAEALQTKYKDDHKKLSILRKQNKDLTVENNLLLSESDRVIKLSREIRHQLEDNSLRGMWKRLWY